MKLLVLVVTLVTIGYALPYEKAPLESTSADPNSSIHSPSASPASPSSTNELHKETWTVDGCISGVLRRAEQRGQTCHCKTENMMVFGQLSSVKNGDVSCCLRACKGDEVPLSSTALEADAVHCCHGIAQLLKDRV